MANDQQQKKEYEVLKPCLDMADVEDFGPTIAPEGEVDGNGNRLYQFTALFLLVEGVNAGKKIRWWGKPYGKGKPFCEDGLMGLGWDGNPASLAAFKPLKRVPIAVINRTLAATEKYPVAKVQHEVKKINPALPRPKKVFTNEREELAPDAAKAAMASLQAMLGGDASPAAAPAGAPAPFATGADKTNLPF